MLFPAPSGYTPLLVTTRTAQSCFVLRGPRISDLRFCISPHYMKAIRRFLFNETAKILMLFWDFTALCEGHTRFLCSASREPRTSDFCISPHYMKAIRRFLFNETAKSLMLFRVLELPFLRSWRNCGCKFRVLELPFLRSQMNCGSVDCPEQ